MEKMAGAYETMLGQIKEQERRDQWKKDHPDKAFERKPKAIRRFERYSRMGGKNEGDGEST